MWEVRSQQSEVHGEEYEMLTATEAAQHAKEAGDSDTNALERVQYRRESYQSTAYIITHGLCVLTGLMLVATCATFGSSIASNRKKEFNIDSIMPSVDLARGDCDTLKYANLAFHLFINCIGTIIIGCSNYLQQSSPSFAMSDISMYKSDFRRHQDRDEEIRRRSFRM
jgi:hypothetical protein